jgi:hypothetical protein
MRCCFPAFGSMFETANQRPRLARQQQYRSIVDAAAVSFAGLKTPPEGWLRTIRNALGMSGAELAKKMGDARARVTQAEHAELTGGITLKSMQASARKPGTTQRQDRSRDRPTHTRDCAGNAAGFLER